MRTFQFKVRGILTMKKGKKKIKILPWQLGKGDKDKFYGKILEREHIFRYIHRLYATAYLRGKEKIIKIDKSGPTPKPGKYYDQHLTITKARHWNAIVRAVNKLAVYTGWSVGGEQNELRELISGLGESSKTPKDLKKINRIAKKRLRKNKRLKKELDLYRQQLAELVHLHRTTNLPIFRKSLREFKELVSQKRTEGCYQKFLAHSSNAWILGLEYVSVNRHQQAGTEGFPDFMPQRFDGFHDVVEFKRPNDNIFVSRGGRWRQSGPLKDGISQLMDYLELLDRKPTGSDDIAASPDKYRANGLLIIGDLKGSSDSKKLKFALRRHNSFLQRIRIITYDELVEQAGIVLKNLEKEK